jgi:hypothetical protein
MAGIRRRLICAVESNPHLRPVSPRWTVVMLRFYPFPEAVARRRTKKQSGLGQRESAGMCSRIGSTAPMPSGLSPQARLDDQSCPLHCFRDQRALAVGSADSAGEGW